MKPTLLLLLFLAMLTLPSCMTEHSTVTAPDGTVTETTKKSADPVALTIGGKVLDTYIAVKVPRIEPSK